MQQENLQDLLSLSRTYYTLLSWRTVKLAKKESWRQPDEWEHKSCAGNPWADSSDTMKDSSQRFAVSLCSKCHLSLVPRAINKCWTKVVRNVNFSRSHHSHWVTLWICFNFLKQVSRRLVNFRNVKCHAGFDKKLRFTKDLSLSSDAVSQINLRHCMENWLTWK